MVEISRLGRGPRIQGNIPFGLASALPRAAQQNARSISAVTGDLSNFLEERERARAKFLEKKQQAQANADFNMEFASFSEEVSNLRYDISRSPDLKPLEKREHFNSQVKSLQKKYGKNLPPLLQQELQTKAQTLTTSLGNQIDVEGTREFNEEESQNLEAQLQLATRQYARTTDPIEKNLILGNVDGYLKHAVDAGIIGEEQGKLFFSEFEEDSIVQEVEIAVRSNPQEMYDHVFDLLNGDPGNSDMPDVPVDMRAKVFDQVQNELAESMRYAANLEAKEERELDKSQEQYEAQTINEILKLDGDPTSLTNLRDQINLDRKKRKISADGAIRAQKFIASVISSTEETNDPIKESMAIQLLRNDPEAAMNFVYDNHGNGFTTDFTRSFTTQAQSRANSQHFTNSPAFKRSEDFVTSLVDENLLSNVLEASQITALKQDAIQEHYDLAATFAGEGGINQSAVNQRLPEIQQKIREVYQQKINNAVQGGAAKTIQPDLPTLLQWGREQVGQGQPVDRIRRIIRKDLDRFYIRSGGDITNAQQYDQWIDQWVMKIYDPSMEIKVPNASR